MNKDNILESGFYDFINSISLSYSLECIDFFGIDLSKNEFVFKAYINENNCDFYDKMSPCGVLRSLSESKMIYRLEIVQDTRRIWNGRYDIALDNRSNKNMTRLWTLLMEKASYIKKHESLIHKLASMKITDDHDYDSSAWYHLSVKEDKNMILGLKFYFLTRYQKQLSFYKKNAEYRDTEYLELIGNTGCNCFLKLKSIVENILTHCGGHVWMAAVDIPKDGRVKYKIYLKECVNVYTYLRNALNGCYKKQAELLMEWQKKHTELRLMGLAIGIDEDDRLSLNLYFVFI